MNERSIFAWNQRRNHFWNSQRAEKTSETPTNYHQIANIEVGLATHLNLNTFVQVTVFQLYDNRSWRPLEARYVFPLSEEATVVGFEAYIGSRHVIGHVEEKQRARREYREAIAKGHGAYLMEEEKPDVFTVSES